MPIASSDIKFYLSGGAANSDPNASLGGERSSTELVDATLHNLFDVVGSSEAADGDVEYRCIYVRNEHATLTLLSALAYLFSNTPSDDTDAAFALGTAAIGGTEQTVADESTEPTGVTWENGIGVENAQAIGDLAPGDHIAIWVRRTVSAGAAAYSSDGAVIRVQGDTAA